MTPIEKVRAALEYYSNFFGVDPAAYDALEALRELDGMVLVPVEPPTLPKGFTELDYAEMIAPYLPEKK